MQLEEKTIEMEQEIFEMETTQLELVEQLKSLEFSNEGLQIKIRQLIEANEKLEKGQAVYIGHKYDKVDKALGSYLNHFPERSDLKIMFLRESEGVYQFGQKRVYVKIEKGD